jgi:hypothetical protein
MFFGVHIRGRQGVHVETVCGELGDRQRLVVCLRDDRSAPRTREAAVERFEWTHRDRDGEGLIPLNDAEALAVERTDRAYRLAGHDPQRRESAPRR